MVDGRTINVATTASSSLSTDHGRQNSVAILQRILFCPSQERTARELHSMDARSREQVWADMAGHDDAVNYRMHQAETLEFVNDRLTQFDLEIQNLLQPMEASSVPSFYTKNAPTTVLFEGVDGRHAYLLAYQYDPEWVQAQRLKFLRTEDFDAALAAARFMRFLALKLYLLQDDNCHDDDDVSFMGRDITLDDLNADDQKSLFAGGMQFLSKYDHAGRGVFFTRRNKFVYKTHKNQLRALLFTVQLGTRNVQCQKLGYVSVSYMLGRYSKDGGYDFELSRLMSQFAKAIPVRFSGIYICIDSISFKPVTDLIEHLVSPLMRVRLRTIHGSAQECLYQIFALGIPIDAMPLTREGAHMLDYHKLCIEDEDQVAVEQGEL